MKKIKSNEVSVHNTNTARVGKVNSTYILKSRHELFETEDFLQVRVNEEYIEIERTSIDSRKSYEVKEKQGAKVLFFNSELDLNTGRFEIDEEESNEDLIVIYL